MIDRFVTMACSFQQNAQVLLDFLLPDIFAQAARSYAHHWVYVQRLNRFNEWVTLKKVTLNRQGAQRFRLKKLPAGRNHLRTFMTVNQAGSGYFSGTSPVLSFRRA